MKVRWTQNSLRLRITPSELDALGRDEPVRAHLALPGGLTWRVALHTDPAATRLTSTPDEVSFFLSRADLARLEQPDTEGVYFQTEAPPAPNSGGASLRYFVEKDFPCAHPRLVDALEAAPETFAPTAEFEARKAGKGSG